MKQGTTNLPIERDNSLIFVRDVPGLICSECSESYISSETMKQVETQIDTALAGEITIGIVSFKAAA